MAIQSAAGNGALNYSLEFMGGTSTSVTFNEDLTIEDIDNEVKPVFQEVTGDANIQAQKVTCSNEVIIKTRALDLDERTKLNELLVENFSVDESLISSENISSRSAGRCARTHWCPYSLLPSACCCTSGSALRISVFAASAVLALVHDVLVVLTFYALSRISVGNTFIACMLTMWVTPSTATLLFTLR